MSRRIGATAVLGAACVGIASGAFSLLGERGVKAGQPVVVVLPSMGENEGKRPVADETYHQGVNLAVRSLDRALRQRLLRALTRRLDEMENATNPFDLGLEPDRGDVDRLEVLASSLLPAVAASVALVEGRATMSGDATGTSRWSIFVASACPPTSRDIHCAPLWGDDKNDPLVARGKFAVWPWTHAAIIELADDAAVASAGDALRRAAADGKSRIALVSTGADLLQPTAGLDPSGEVGELAGQARRLLARLDAPARSPNGPGRSLGEGRIDDDERTLLRALASADDARPIHLAVAVAPRTLLVVPRLSTLADLDAFVAEVDAELVASGLAKSAVWRRRPTRPAAR